MSICELRGSVVDLTGSTPPLRILFVSHVFPWPADSGTHQRVFRLLEALGAQHEVTLLAFSAECRCEANSPLPDICRRIISVPTETQARFSSSSFDRWAPIGERLRMLTNSSVPSEVRGRYSADFKNALDELQGEDFDLVWVERAFLVEMVSAAGFQRIVVDLDASEAVSLRRELSGSRWYLSKPLHYVHYFRWRRYERRLSRRVSRIVLCNPDDITAIGGHPNRFKVIPNGAEIATTLPSPQASEGRHILFVGLMSYAPNCDAVLDFARDVLPAVRRLYPEVQFHIVGRDPPVSVRSLAGRNGVQVHGFVENLDLMYARAGAVVAPIRYGSGTRLKVLEALARRRPVIASSIAVEGLDLRPGTDFLLANAPREFVLAIDQLFRGPDAAEEMAEIGRERVAALYAWPAIQAEVVRLVSECIEEVRRPSASTPTGNDVD